MTKGKLVFLTFLVFSLAFFLSGCGFTNQAPEANFSADPTSGPVSLEVSFDASDSSDPDGDIASYDWDFDDGSTDSGETVSHTFENAGDYEVELTVTDDAGATDTTTKTISVTSSNQAPSADFTASSTSGEAPLEVDFDASGSNDPDGDIASYDWDFDDGSTDSGVNVTNTFDSSGTYDVNLTVTDDDGATDSTSRTISVNEPPTAKISTTPSTEDGTLTVGVEEEVTFDAGDSEPNGGEITDYEWDFKSGEDGTATATGETVTYTYAETGTFTAQLTVTDDQGATDTAEITVEVEIEPPPPP